MITPDSSNPELLAFLSENTSSPHQQLLHGLRQIATNSTNPWISPSFSGVDWPEGFFFDDSAKVGLVLILNPELSIPPTSDRNPSSSFNLSYLDNARAYGALPTCKLESFLTLYGGTPSVKAEVDGIIDGSLRFFGFNKGDEASVSDFREALEEVALTIASRGRDISPWFNEILSRFSVEISQDKSEKIAEALATFEQSRKEQQRLIRLQSLDDELSKSSPNLDLSFFASFFETIEPRELTEILPNFNKTREQIVQQYLPNLLVADIAYHIGRLLPDCHLKFGDATNVSSRTDWHRNPFLQNGTLIASSPCLTEICRDVVKAIRELSNSNRGFEAFINRFADRLSQRWNLETSPSSTDFKQIGAPDFVSIKTALAGLHSVSYHSASEATKSNPRSEAGEWYEILFSFGPSVVATLNKMQQSDSERYHQFDSKFIRTLKLEVEYYQNKQDVDFYGL